MTQSNPDAAVRSLEFRPLVGDDDLVFAVAVWNAERPDDPIHPDEQRYYWSHSEDWVTRRFIVGSEPDIGWLEVTHLAWDKQPERVCRVRVHLLPAESTDARLEEAYGFCARLAHEEGARTLLARAFEDQADLVRLLEQLGYRRDSVEEIRELDLRQHKERLLRLREDSRRRMAAQGIELTTLAAVDDPEKVEKLHACFVEADSDSPHTFAFVPTSLEEFTSEISGPFTPPERIWVARRGESIVGESWLHYPPGNINVWTSWTGTARSVRNLGVARALKLETFAQALELGVGSVRTGNDERNAPMLHINDELGYVRIPGMVRMIKTLRS